MTGLVSLGPTRSVRRMADEADYSKAFAQTVLGAAAAGNTEDALKLYDQGVAEFGPGFRDTYYTLRDQAAAADEKFGPSENRGPLQKVESIPTSVVTPKEGTRLASGLRSLDKPAVEDNVPADYVAEPDQPFVPRQDRTSLPVIRDRSAVDAGQGVDLDRALTDKDYRESIIPTPDQPRALPRDTTQLPIMRPDRNEANTSGSQAFRGSAKEEAVARGVSLEQVEAERAAELEAARLVDAPPAPAPAPTSPIAAAAATMPPEAAPSGLPAPDMTGGYGAGALSGLPVPAEADPSFSFRTSQTTQGSGGVPRTIRPIVAPRGSGGLASMAGAPPAPAPAPAPAPEAPPAPPVAAPAPAAPAAAAAAPTEAGDNNRYWEALIQAGLGTMASQNSSALGAIGEGGMAGVQQLGQIRKEMRDEKRDKAETAYREGSLANQRENTAVAREGIASQDRRAAESIQAQKDIQRESIASQERLLNQKLANDLTVQGMQINSQYDLLNARAGIEAQLQDRKADLERQGLQWKREDTFKFGREHGLSDETTALIALGITPSKADKPNPMGEKETTLAFDLAAGSILGEGATGNQLLDLIPTPAVKAEVLSAVSNRSDASGGAAAALQVLRKNNIVPTDNSTWGGIFGTTPGLKQVQPAGGASFTYVPGKGAVPK